jgi:hypothetical protein
MRYLFVLHSPARRDVGGCPVFFKYLNSAFRNLALSVSLAWIHPMLLCSVPYAKGTAHLVMDDNGFLK